MAKDLEGTLLDGWHAKTRDVKETYAMKAITATLARVTAPLSRPTPTPTSESTAPMADSDKSFFRPRRYVVHYQ